VEVRLNYPLLDVIFLLIHRGILVFWFFAIHRTIRLLWEVSLSHPLCFRLSFLLRCGCASCHREERIVVRDLPNLPKTGRMFG
jgi:hypothetical protein